MGFLGWHASSLRVDGTLVLAEKPNLPPGLVEVIVEPLPDFSRLTFGSQQGRFQGGGVILLSARQSADSSVFPPSEELGVMASADLPSIDYH